MLIIKCFLVSHTKPRNKTKGHLAPQLASIKSGRLQFLQPCCCCKQKERKPRGKLFASLCHPKLRQGQQALLACAQAMSRSTLRCNAGTRKCARTSQELFETAVRFIYHCLLNLGHALYKSAHDTHSSALLLAWAAPGLSLLAPQLGSALAVRLMYRVSGLCAKHSRTPFDYAVSTVS